MSLQQHVKRQAHPSSGQAPRWPGRLVTGGAALALLQFASLAAAQSVPATLEALTGKVDEVLSLVNGLAGALAPPPTVLLTDALPTQVHSCSVVSLAPSRTSVTISSVQVTGLAVQTQTFELSPGEAGVMLSGGSGHMYCRFESDDASRLRASMTVTVGGVPTVTSVAR